MNYLDADFYDFISKDCNRYEFLCKKLTSLNIKFSTIVLDERKHIYLQFPLSSYNPMFKIKTLLVHYDRVENSPGANDNSAAVFQILKFAEYLSKCNYIHNMRIFLTDGEEIGSENGVLKQGSFGIAGCFKKLGIVKDDIITIDTCGRGDILVVSSTGQNSNAPYNFRKNFDNIFKRTCKLAGKASPEKWISAPVPYSDNAGFIAMGIPAVAVTVLPKEEATCYLRLLRCDKNAEKAFLSNDINYRTKQPKTWQMMHTMEDNAESLTEEAFLLMYRFLKELSELKTVV